MQEISRPSPQPASANFGFLAKRDRRLASLGGFAETRGRRDAEGSATSVGRLGRSPPRSPALGGEGTGAHRPFEPGAAPITLIDGETLIQPLIDYGIGVEVQLCAGAEQPLREEWNVAIRELVEFREVEKK